MSVHSRTPATLILAADTSSFCRAGWGSDILARTRGKCLAIGAILCRGKRLRRFAALAKSNRFVRSSKNGRIGMPKTLETGKGGSRQAMDYISVFSLKTALLPALSQIDQVNCGRVTAQIL